MIFVSCKVTLRFPQDVQQLYTQSDPYIEEGNTIQWPKEKDNVPKTLRRKLNIGQHGNKTKTKTKNITENRQKHKKTKKQKTVVIIGAPVVLP